MSKNLCSNADVLYSVSLLSEKGNDIITPQKKVSGARFESVVNIINSSTVLAANYMKMNNQTPN